MAEKEQEENCPVVNNKILDLLVKSCLENNERKLRITTVNEIKFVSDDVIFEPLSTFTLENYIVNLERLIHNNEYTDVAICIENQTFQCHLELLQCYSDYFMAFNGFSVIRIPEGSIKPDSFRLAYEWMKTDDAKPKRDGIVELYLTAKYLQLNELVSQLWFCFDDTTLFNEDQAFLIYLDAIKYDVKMLKEVMLSRISKFFLCVVATKEFLEFTEKEIISLLTANFIAVNSEMEIFMTILRWLNYNWNERIIVAEKLLKHVRFSLMPCWFLTTLESMQKPSIIREIIQMPEIMKSIENGISYAVANQFMGAQLPIIDIFSRDQQLPRQWIINEKCNYHHKYLCKKWEFITYDAFNNYLSHIIETHGIGWKDFKNESEEPSLICGCDIID